MNRLRAVSFAAAALACSAGARAVPLQVAQTPASLSRLSIEELADVEISSVSRRPERVADAPAAVYVITQDEIRQSGANTLPEVLRLAPNLQVARVNSSSYAITARGFNNASANKLLVMIDGRSVYTPLHSGVFWDVQDVVIGDIDRIEVVSGPGGTLWGANAVNGVINIITRSAAETKGTLAGAVLGSQEQGVAARHGWSMGRDAGLRVYARSFRFGHSVRADDSAVSDEWNRRQVGWRADGTARRATWTLQGDAYEGTAQVPGSPDREVSGGNVLMRVAREFDARSGVQLQAYVDQTQRRQPGLFSERLDTFDVDVQHRFSIAGRHDLVWGGGMRNQRDRTTGSSVLAFVPADSRLTLWNLFAQDTMQLSPRVRLTAGLKAERNDYTGTEYQPSVRVAWKRNEQSMMWAAVSRAVRIPSRLDRDLQIYVNLAPPYNAPLLGGSRFIAERLTAFEWGYRGQPNASLSYSVSLYVNDYTRLRSVEPSGNAYVLGNEVRGRTQGLEAWGSYQASPTWRLSAGLNLLHEDLSFTAASADPGLPAAGADDPRNQLSLRSAWTMPRGWRFDIGMRAVSSLPQPHVPGYAAVDARLAYAVSQQFEVSLAGFNLLDDHHPEFGPEAQRSEVPRSLALRLLWSL